MPVNTSSIAQLKKTLQTVPQVKVVELCLRLAKYKKENKELLTYLLFDAEDEAAYVTDVKDQIQNMFEDLNHDNTYLAKKTIRKILRLTNKYIKFSGSKQTEVELLLFFCKQMKYTGISLDSNTALKNMVNRQITKINKTLSALHEDLQHDYQNDLNDIGYADQDSN